MPISIIAARKSLRQPGAKMCVVMNNAAHDPKMTESVLNG